MTSPLAKWFKMTTMTERLRKSGIRDDVVAAAEMTAFGRHSDRILPSLARSLDPMEAVLRMLEGRWNRAVGLVVLTDHRLVLFPQHPSPSDLIVIDRQDLLSASGELRRGQGILSLTFRAIDESEQTISVDQILGNQAETMAQGINEVINGDIKALTAQQDPLDGLAELRSKRDAGEISDEEFERVKRELFRQI